MLLNRKIVNFFAKSSDQRERTKTLRAAARTGGRTCRPVTRIRTTTSVLACWMLAFSVAAAQDAKPLVTASFSGYDALKADLDHLGKLAGNQNFAAGLEGMLQMMTQNQALQAVDQTKPWGLVVQATSEGDFPIYGFLPTKEIKKLLDLISKQGITAEDVGGGVYEITAPQQMLYAKASGGYAVVAQAKEALDSPPGDPEKLLGDLPKNYDLAVQLTVSNLPEPTRQMIMAQIQMGMQMAMQPMPGEDEQQFAMRTASAQQAIDQISTLLEELEQITLGLKIDAQTSTASFDVNLTAKPNTKTAQQFAAMQTATTDFAGMVLPEAAITGNWAGRTTDADVAQATASLTNLQQTAERELANQGLTEEQLKLAKQLLGDAFDVLTKTIELKKSDGGMSVVMKPDALTFVAGMLLAEGQKLEDVIKQLVDVIKKEEPEAANLVQLDADSAEGVRYHVISIPIPDDDAGRKLQELVGKPTFELVIGLSDNAIYVGGGRDALSTLKQAVTDSKNKAGTEILPAKVVVHGTPIAKFISGVAQEEEVKSGADFVATMLEQSNGKDAITITSSAVPNGAQVRIELEEGWLTLLGSGMQMGMAGAAGGM
ncbi:MAG: hypothetical protein ACOY3P_13640 [Planctomycetota bacterium]